MPITGYYDGTAVQVDVPLLRNQKVIVIPIENEADLVDSVAGGLHKYANVSLIEQEKKAWKKRIAEKYAQE